MVKIEDEGIILEHSESGFDDQAVLNPACAQKDDKTYMFYRAVRKGDMVSSIGCCQLEENKKAVKRLDKPVVFPEYGYEQKGVEDPRIVFLDDTYYLFYTVYDGKNALFAYATSPDLISFTKHGIISPRITYAEAGSLFAASNIKMREKYFLFASYIMHRQGIDILLWEKDAFIFPKKFNNKFALVHRVLPGIQVIYFDDFNELTDDYWRNYLGNLGEYVILDPLYRFESRNVGGGCPPIETEDGWLLIYHGVEDSRHGRIYHAAAALLDINDPTKVIGRLQYPLFSPVEKWEKHGDVNNVVFPTGTVLKQDRLYIYYGAADKLIAAKSLDIKELLTELKNNKDSI
ncbi:MAG: pesticidal protein Cry7Aa [Candidatus Ratteibacteria bacterium]|nr:pesticidal protein Cry7Aa [Candidatus Ratteibacteria bacterium]